LLYFALQKRCWYWRRALYAQAYFLQYGVPACAISSLCALAQLYDGLLGQAAVCLLGPKSQSMVHIVGQLAYL
jgi:hypothetical protein